MLTSSCQHVEIISSPVPSDSFSVVSHDIAVQPDTETLVILEALNKPQRDMDSYLKLMDEHYSFVRSSAESNVEIAAMACEQLARLKASVVAQMNKPHIPRLPAELTQEPVNKNTARQRRFFSMKRKAIKRKPEESFSKPGIQEKVYIASLLDGNVQTVSQSYVNTDHDYNVQASELATLDHCY
jgi:hypothetical protein